MSHGIYTALSGALSQQHALDVTATNLANAETTGYRSLRPVFREVLSDAGSTKEQEQARFNTIRRTTVDTARGNVRVTNRALDITLPENAFLTVERPQGGVGYTRAGALDVRQDGTLVTRSGHVVLGEGNQPIKLAQQKGLEVTIAENGAVRLGDKNVANLQVVTFADAREMTLEGKNIAVPGQGAGEPQASTEKLEIGKLEGSNATPVRAMTEMMMASRMFQAMERAIGSFRTIDERVATTVAR